MSKNKRSPFCHVVIPAPDMAAAKAFYESVFGWSVKERIPGDTYWFFESGNVGGGFDGSVAPVTHSNSFHLRVDDIESTLKLVKKHGGKVVRGKESLGEADPGHDAHIADPNGNTIGLYADS